MLVRRILHVATRQPCQSAASFSSQAATVSIHARPTACSRLTAAANASSRLYATAAAEPTTSTKRSTPVPPTTTSTPASASAASAPPSSSNLSTLSSEEIARLSTFAARSGITCSESRLLEALTHLSYREVDGSIHHERYRILGSRVLEFYLSEFLSFKYPSLPGDALESTIEAYTSARSLYMIGKSLGVQHTMRWKRSGSEGTSGESAVVGKVLQAIIGAIYLDKGPTDTRNFIKAHFLSRTIDLQSHLKLQNPKYLLGVVATRLKRQQPIARLLKETGRLSTAPIFIVGMYSGVDKIGEGHGSSLSMAEYRAARNALENHFMVEVKDIELPSDVEDLEARTTFMEKN